jgi:hypothetical protein
MGRGSNPQKNWVFGLDLDGKPKIQKIKTQKNPKSDLFLEF